jgi:hypothetical protein
LADKRPAPPPSVVMSHHTSISTPVVATSVDAIADVGTPAIWQAVIETRRRQRPIAPAASPALVGDTNAPTRALVGHIAGNHLTRHHVEGGLGALRTRKADDHDERIIARQRQLGRTVVDNELQRETIRRLEDGLPLALRRSKR